MWFVLLALVVAAYILAAYYLQGDKLKNGSYASVPVWEKLVDSLRIFPSGFPGYDDGQVWEYNFARYLAAFVFLLASFRLLAIAFGDRLTEARAGIRHGHVVVCGLGDTGRRSVRTFRAEGDNVTCIESDTGGDGGAEARADGALVLSGDATQVTSLDSARADSARAVVCACADDATNTRVATLVAATVAAANKRDGPDVYVRVEDPGLAQLLRGRLPAAGATVFHFFSAAAVWARAMLDDARGPFAAAEPDPPGVIVLGNTELGVAVAVGAARRWHEHVRDRSLAGRARITVCGAGAPATCAGLVERYPAVPRVCDLVGIEHTPDSTFPAELDSGFADAGPGVVYVCVDDPGDRLAAAFDAAHRVDRKAGIFVSAGAAAAVVTPVARAERIHVIDLTRAASVDLIHDQMRDRFAREAHEVWLEQRRKATDFGTQSSDKPWDELSDDYRRASYAHVHGMSEQLQAVWYEIEPLADWDEPPEQLPEMIVEAMSELEHARWCRERRAAGWRYGRTRKDDRRKLHPLLVPWSELTEDKRDLDRELVRQRPAILARAGYRLARSAVRDQLARMLHERYRTEQGARGVEVAPWSELTESARRANLAAVDDIAVKLAHIGCWAMPVALGFSPPASLSPAIEQLAELEHDRWMDERRADGWTLGARDDKARTHPSLVPWDELPESEKEKDRDVVRAIPDLLAAAGLTIVRDS